MADDFDSQLSRMFSDVPVFADSGAFAAQVTARLERDWSMRRAMIGVGGLAAGVVVAWQFIAGRFSGDLTAVSDGAVAEVTRNLGRVSADLNQLMIMPAGNETLWFGVALAAIALTFAVTRAVDNI
jgi:hypothetical protein